MENLRFHGGAEKYERYICNSLDRSLSSKLITKEDRELIEEFINHISSTAEHLSPMRRFNLVCLISRSRQYLKKPFRVATQKDLESAMGGIRQTSELKQNTKSDYIRFLKRFYLWLAENEYTAIREKEIRKFKVPRLDATTKTAEGMLTDEEVKSIIEHCKNSRDRLIVMLMYEGGFRISEIATLKWGQIKIEDWGLIVNVSGKTEVPRLVPCPDSRSFLAAYKNDNKIPDDPAPDDLVFWIIRRLNKEEEPQKMGIQYKGIDNRIKQAAREAGIKKKVNLHLFRHSAITSAVRDGMSEAIIKQIFWGNANTGMMKTYQHLGSRDIINAVRTRYGIDKEPVKIKDKKTFGAVQCQCGFMNPPGVKYCGQCASGLTEEARVTVQTTAREISMALTPDQKKSALSSMSKEELLLLLQEIAASK
jgi:integrase/recombinase XerD